jgi:hypothetical protein
MAVFYNYVILSGVFPTEGRKNGVEGSPVVRH